MSFIFDPEAMIKAGATDREIIKAWQRRTKELDGVDVPYEYARDFCIAGGYIRPAAIDCFGYWIPEIVLQADKKEKEPENSTMTPERIKYELALAGYTLARVGFECGVSSSAVSRIVNNNGTSHKIRCFIADIIGREVGDIWEVKPNPTKPGRPDSKNPIRQTSERLAA